MRPVASSTVSADDGNGWVECRCGARHWGRHGAAGLLLVRDPQGAPGDGAGAGAGGGADDVEVLLQLRAPWVHQGGTWALPGGAADSHESAVEAALREAHEEAGVVAAEVEVLGAEPTTEHGDWSYTTVLARLAGPGTTVGVANPESVQIGWTALEEVDRLDLHPAFGRAWPGLRARLVELLDAAVP